MTKEPSQKQKKAKPDINSEELLSKIRWRNGKGYEVYMYVKPIIDEMLGKESERGKLHKAKTESSTKSALMNNINYGFAEEDD